MYPFHWPFAIAIASIGMPLLIKIDVFHDDEAGVYIATSPNVKGLNVEAESLDEIKKEVELVLPEFLAITAGLIDNTHKLDQRLLHSGSRTRLEFSAPLYA